ncbi:MAG: helix-turn-helix domain-containing protein [bacterium]
MIKLGDDEEYRKALGARLKLVSKENNKKLDDLSKIFGIKKVTISQWWRGIGRPTPLFLLEFSKEFGVNLVWLISGSGPKYYKEEIQTTISKVQDESFKSYYKEKEDKILEEVINYLINDKEFLKTVWHMIKAKEGIKKFNQL